VSTQTLALSFSCDCPPPALHHRGRPSDHRTRRATCRDRTTPRPRRLRENRVRANAAFVAFGNSANFSAYMTTTGGALTVGVGPGSGGNVNVTGGYRRRPVMVAGIIQSLLCIVVVATGTARWSPLGENDLIAAPGSVDILARGIHRAGKCRGSNRSEVLHCNSRFTNHGRGLSKRAIAPSTTERTHQRAYMEPNARPIRRVSPRSGSA